jgi:hypothetical protein
VGFARRGGIVDGAGVFSNGSFDNATTISGDEGLSGSGYVRINYLLKRDLDLASNDNSPAFVNAAA